MRTNQRRARATFDLMADLGVDTVLVCSAVAPDAVGDDDELTAQLAATADLAAEHGLRIAYEALARGTCWPPGAAAGPGAHGARVHRAARRRHLEAGRRRRPAPARFRAHRVGRPRPGVAGAGAAAHPREHDEARLFCDSVLGLDPGTGTEVAAPFGPVRSHGVTTPDRAVRLAPSVSRRRLDPRRPDPQHVAFATDDGDDDGDGDGDAGGAFMHLYTEVLGGRVYFEVVQRLGGHDGYGAVNSPALLAAHRRARQDTRAGAPSTRSR